MQNGSQKANRGTATEGSCSKGLAEQLNAGSTGFGDVYGFQIQADIWIAKVLY